MATYIPSDETARFLAREYIRTKLSEELQRGRLTLTLGEMADDGTCPVHLVANPDDFNFRAYFEDHPQIDGRAWIDDGARHDVGYEFEGGSLQPYAFMREHQSV